MQLHASLSFIFIALFSLISLVAGAVKTTKSALVTNPTDLYPAVTGVTSE